ncbi:hypothetical protein CS034_03641 [Phocaeicola vulgatus]|nr:hypothetical protein [Phocaeicola vulgatus]
MAYEMVMPYHLHMPSYFLETFTEYPDLGSLPDEYGRSTEGSCHFKIPLCSLLFLYYSRLLI